MKYLKYTTLSGANAVISKIDQGMGYPNSHTHTSGEALKHATRNEWYVRIMPVFEQFLSPSQRSNMIDSVPNDFHNDQYLV